MPIPSSAYLNSMKPALKAIVDKGWDTNRERDSTDGHDRSTADDKLRTAMLAIECSWSLGQGGDVQGAIDTFGEGMAFLIEVEMQLRHRTQRSPSVIKEMMEIELANKASPFGCGVILGLAWTLGLIDSNDLGLTLQPIGDGGVAAVISAFSKLQERLEQRKQNSPETVT